MNMSEVIWLCNDCETIAEDGWVWLPGLEMDKAVEALQAAKEFSDSHPKFYTVEELLALPDGGEWSVICTECYEDDMERMNDYDISLERISTVKDILDWTFHLSKKNWFEHTNWEDFVRGAIPENLDA
jgi:hypothetical protein